jgi:hypothetical protein
MLEELILSIVPEILGSRIATVVAVEELGELVRTLTVSPTLTAESVELD